MSYPSAQSSRTMCMSLGFALLFSLISWLGVSQPVYAASDAPSDTLASIQVNTNNPAINASDGLCSIIEAIENANADASLHADCAAGSGDDTISLPINGSLIFTATHNSTGGANALPVITSNITIVGNGANLIRNTSGAPDFRFFNVAPGATLTLNNVGLSNGKAELSGTSQLLLGGGAIVNAGTLHVINSRLSFNQASYGGAIYSESVTGTLTLNNSSLTSNIADFNGGAVYSFGSATIEGGSLRSNQAAVSGGAVVLSSGTLNVTNVVVQDNSTAGSGAGIAAYAVITDSHVVIRSSNIISNVAALSGGGLLNSADNGMTSIVEVENSTISGNRADSTALNQGLGGGAVNGWLLGLGGGVTELHLSQSLVADNVAQNGGGIANVDVTGYATRTAEVLISQSTLMGNLASGSGSEQGSGGGLYNSNGHATVVNSTVSDNEALGDDTALGGRGGGIANRNRGTTTTVQVLNSTIAFNAASQAGGGIAIVGPPASATSLEAGNTLIVSNRLAISGASAASPQVIGGTESCSIENGSSSSLGGNIEDRTTCGLNTSADLQNTPVTLGLLTDNGGSTPTHLISNTGPAYNSGVDALCSAAPVNSVDQRGIARPQVGRCDVGAVELEPAPPEPVIMIFPQIYLHFTWP